jgi:hypothetical protein
MLRRQAKPRAESPMIARLMEELQRQGRYTIDDIAQVLADRLQVWADGRAEIQRHLTQAQAIRLANDDRLERAVRLNADLPAAELGASIVLPNARLLLSTLLEGDGAALTQAGFLNRKFLMAIGGKLDWPEFDWQEICAISKVVNEVELTPVWFLHGVLKLAGLAHARRRVLRVGKRGRELMAPERAGALQAALFRAAWRDLNLAGLSRFGLAERLQWQGNSILFMIGRLADDWIDSERLLHCAVAPDREILAAPEGLPLSVFRWCILRPLCWFGLLDMRELPTEIEWRRRYEYRKIPLFDRFLAFDPGPA